MNFLNPVFFLVFSILCEVTMRSITKTTTKPNTTDFIDAIAFSFFVILQKMKEDDDEK